MKHECRIISKEEVLANRSSAYEFIDFDKQETLEEAAEQFGNNYWNPEFDAGVVYGFIEGAKWQQERMYSEEEVQVKLYECLGHFAQKHNIIINGSEIDQWFEQSKEKQQEKSYSEEEVIKFGQYLTKFDNLDNESKYVIKELLKQYKNK